MKFAFKGRTADGQEVSGTREAADRFALAHEMRAEGVTLVSAEALSARRRRPPFWNRLRGGVSLKEKMVFAGSLAAMLGAGLSLTRALGILQRQTASKIFREALSGVLEKISAGSSLHDALADFPEIFPRVFVSMVAAGEEAGRLSESLKLIRQQLEKSYGLRRKIIGAMIYPAIVMAVMIVVGILMMIFLVPTLARLFAELEAELPFTTRVVIFIGNFLASHTLIFLVSLAAIIFAAVWFSKTFFGRRFFAAVFLHLPIITRLLRNLNSAATLRTLSSLIASGVSMAEAMTIAADVVQNYYYKKVLLAGRAAVERGVPLSSVFNERPELYPVLVGELVEVGEETGNLSGMLLNGAEFFEEEVEQTTKNLATVIEPVLMVIVGLAVGFFAVAMIGPMYSITTNIKI